MKERIKQDYLKVRRRLLQLLAPVLRSIRRRNRPFSGGAPKILFLRMDRIGDLTLSTSALRAIKKAFPQAHLTVLASRTNVSLLATNPHVDQTCVYPSGKNLLSKWQCLCALRKLSFDIVIDPLTGYDLEPALVAFLSQSRLAIGFEAFGREVFFDRQRTLSECRRGIVDANSDLLGLIGAEDDRKQPELFLTAAEVRSAEEWLSRHAPDGRIRVGVHPGAHYETQRWGVDNFTGLVRIARSTPEVQCILVGGPADAGIVDAIRARIGDGTPVFTHADLRKTMALISRLDALVCNNSGPLHIATALNIPTVSFMGPTDAKRWWPVGAHYRVLRSGHLSCLGCENGICPKGTTDCMRSITPEMAWNSLMNVLAETHEHRFTLAERPSFTSVSSMQVGARKQ